jgi:hypothetical protein
MRNLPLGDVDAGRLARGVGIYYNGKVSPITPTSWAVRSPGAVDSHVVDYLEVDGKLTCSCPDHTKRPYLTCKHMVAVVIFEKGGKLA